MGKVFFLNILILATIFCFNAWSQTDPAFAGIITDHMVLQRGVPVSVWGYAEPGEKIKVCFWDQEKETVTDQEGCWEIYLDPLEATSQGYPLTLTNGTKTVHKEDVVVGEVWLCSGQSNMAMTLPGVDDAEKMIAEADYPLIRMFRMPESPAMEPRRDVTNDWVKCSPATAATFSAVGYFFAKKLYERLDIPVGIIVSAWGGSTVGAWMSRSALDKPFIRQHMPYDMIGYYVNMRPGKLYNGMLYPIVPFAFKGVIWYQGESDAMVDRFNPYLYRYFFKAMIEDWRRTWERADMPFYFVQLPNLFGGTYWPVLRESQDIVERELSHTGMITTIDIGQSRKLHPANKQEFADRLADLALSEQYGLGGAVEYASFRQMEKSGSGLSINFDHASDLKTVDGEEPKAFEIAGVDQVFRPARTKIRGSTILAWNDSVNNPVALRYAFSADPEVNLVNHLNLPVRPFRTDDWHVEGRQFLSKSLGIRSELNHRYNPQKIAIGEMEEWEWAGEGIEEEKFRESNLVRFFDDNKIQILVSSKRNLPEKMLKSPSIIWQKEIRNPQNGLTLQVNAQMFRANLPYKGFSLEVDLAKEGIRKIYRIDFAPMMIYAYRDDYTYILAYDIDNSGYHNYRLAVREDGMAQVYFDRELMGVIAPADIVDTGQTEERSYIRFGKLETKGDMTLNIASVSFDPTGAYAPFKQ